MATPEPAPTVDAGTEDTVERAPSTPGATDEESDPPPPPNRPDGAARRSRTPKWIKILLYGVLAIMAFGDGYGIFLTLLSIIKQDTLQVLAFVFALVLGAVAGAHEIGRLTRARREGRDGNPAWIAALTVFWMSVGGIVVWLRITQPLPGSRRNAVAGLDELQFGLLLLGLYLLTGALAMTTAYRFGSPGEAELDALVRERARATEQANDDRYEYERVAGLAEHTREEQLRYRRDIPNGEVLEGYGAFVQTQGRLRQSWHTGDPAATDELNPPRFTGAGP